MNNREIIAYYYRDHQSELLAFVSSRLGGSNEAEDIVQDVFLRMLLCSNPIMETTLQALAYTIARHLVNDYYRRHTCRTDYAHQLKTRAPRDENSAESVLSIREITEFLERGLLRVPEQCRKIYRMHIYDGMQVSEIAQETGDNYKSVEYRLGIARKEIRKQLKHVS